MTSRRLLESFVELANTMHVGAVKKPLEGAFEDDGCKLADAEKVHIMAVQVRERERRMGLEQVVSVRRL